MRKELCFRVESETGVGMYHHHDTFEAKLNHLDWKLNIHPSPSQDSALEWNKIPITDRENYLFGFSSLVQLRRWLYNEEVIALMMECGLAVSIYTTEDYRIGDTQMIFRGSTATRIGRFDLSN